MNQRYGVYSVNTEGDCEGRSFTNLGIYEGTIEEIALHLADRVYYRLYFNDYKDPIICTGPFEKKAETVEIEYNRTNSVISTQDKRAVQLFRLKSKSISQMTPDEKKLILEAITAGEI